MVQWHCISQDHHRRKIFNNGSGSQTVDITSNIKENAGFYISGNSGSKCNVGTYVYNN